MTNGEKHIERLLSWYKEAVTEDGVCYLTSDDKNTLAYALKCCKHYENIKKDIVTWMLREEPSSSVTKNDLAVNCIVDVLGSYTDLDVPYKREIAENILIKLSSVTTIRHKGRWRKVDTNMYACSKCSHVLTIDPLDNSILEMNTCPFCNAEMEGVEE